MSSRAQAALLAALLAASLVFRLPLLANAEATFTSDEAVNALALQHLLAGRELSPFSWDASYYGIVEGLLAIPFAALLGPTALAFKLSAVLGFLALGVAVFALGRALYGVPEGLVGVALLAVFSPQLLRWSTLAASGFCLIVAWGTLTLLCLLHALRAPLRLRRWAALGFLAGFGLYIFELYLAYFALLLLVGGLVLLARPRSVAPWRRRLAAAAAATAGFALGVGPKIALLASDGRGAKRPTYALAAGEQVVSNFRLLLRDCIPALFGVNLQPDAPLELENGPGLGVAGSWLGAFLVLGYALAWGWALVRVVRSPAGDGGRRLLEGSLVALVPLVALLFVLSPNPQDAGSNRYLLPWLTALPLAATALVRWGRRSLAAAVATGLLACGLPAFQSILWLVDRGLLTPSLEPTVKQEPLREVTRALASRRFAGGYGRYWDAYKATFLAGEQLVFVPYMGWDRYPPYSRRLRQAARVAWIFPGESVELTPAGRAEAARLESSLLNQLASSGRSYELFRAAGYRVYTGRDGRRLLPPPLPLEPVALARPRAEFLLVQVPGRVEAGAEIAARVKVANRSDAHWTASGAPLQAGALRVSASYRWLVPEGPAAVAHGERSLLPQDVPRGGSVEMRVRARAPAVPGRYVIRLTMVQETVAWFDEAGGGSSDHAVEVVPAGR